MINRLLIFFVVITSSAYGLEKAISKADLDEVLGISLSVDEFTAVMREVVKQKEDRGERLRKAVGSDNLTYFMMTSSPVDFDSFNEKLQINIEAHPADFPGIFKQSPRICSHEHVKNLKILSSSADYLFGSFEVYRPHILQGKFLFRFDKDRMHIDHLVIARKGSVKMSEGVDVFKPEDKVFREVKKVYSVGQFVDKGIVEDSLFKNDYFGFSIKFPEKWFQQFRPVPGASLRHFNLTKYAGFRQGNPSIACHSVRIIDLHKFATAEEYLKFVKQGLVKASANMEFLGNVQKVSVGKNSFASLKTKMSLAAYGVAYQEHYVIFKKGCVLSFLINYGKEAEREELVNILKTVAFN